jgi:hypothetical protein
MAYINTVFPLMKGQDKKKGKLIANEGFFILVTAVNFFSAATA